jgi:hypothetical protein
VSSFQKIKFFGLLRFMMAQRFALFISIFYVTAFYAVGASGG